MGANKFGQFLAETGKSLFNNAVGGIIGMGMERHNDKRQIEQQRKLTDMQSQANREMMKYGQDLQYEMWKKTNFNIRVWRR